MLREGSAKNLLGTCHSRSPRSRTRSSPTGLPEMRLADFCNPHFKDEHPDPLWFPTGCAGEPDDSRHPTHFAQPPLFGSVAIGLTPTGERCSSGAPVTPRRQRVSTAEPDGQGPFHQQPVKILGFLDPGHLPPASGPPQALRLNTCYQVTRLSTSFRPLIVSLWEELGPRPPSWPQPQWFL